MQKGGLNLTKTDTLWGFEFQTPSVLNMKGFRVWFNPPPLKHERVRGLVKTPVSETQQGLGFFKTRMGLGFG